MDTVDPCKDVLTTDQQTALGINRSPQPFGADRRGSPGCAYPHGYSEPFYEYWFAPVTAEGAEAWVVTSRTIDKRVVEVAGFGAVEHTLLGEPDSDCVVSVDVAPGQSLDVAFAASSQNFTSEQMCERARVAAEAAIATLSAR